jgi:hypothetical protein
LDEPAYIVDVNLLNTLKPSERHDTDIEEAFFKANPDKGKVWRWPVIGNLIDPSVLPVWILKAQLVLYDLFNWDQLPRLLLKLHDGLCIP